MLDTIHSSEARIVVSSLRLRRPLRPLWIPSRWDKPPRRAIEKLEERCTSSCISYRTLTVAKPATSSLSSRGLADTPGRAIEGVLHQ